MEFRLQKENGDGGVEKTQIIETSNPIIDVLGEPPGALVHPQPGQAGPPAESSNPWAQPITALGEVAGGSNKADSKRRLSFQTSLYDLKRGVKIGLSLLLLSVGGYVAYDFGVNGRDPLDSLNELASLAQVGLPLELLELLGLGSSEVDMPVATNVAPSPKNPDSSPVVEADASSSPIDVGTPAVKGAFNPYWALPNEHSEGAKVIARKITAEEEVSWANALKHKYPYQRYRAVLQIRQGRLAGSETLLWYAMYDEKLWIRMRALMGLADLGAKVTVGHLKLALGKEHDSRTANFFKRFVDKAPTDGELYVMRQAIRLLGERSRLVILKILEKSQDNYRNLYLAAASMDPGPHVADWLKRNYIIFDMNGEEYRKHIESIKAKAEDHEADLLKATIPLNGPRIDGQSRPTSEVDSKTKTQPQAGSSAEVLPSVISEADASL